MGWFNRRDAVDDDTTEERQVVTSISNPAVAAFFGGGAPNYTGVAVGESTALSLSPVWRAVSLISGTIASLPVSAVQDLDDGTSQLVPSWIDNPAGSLETTPFEFWETMLLHLLVHGNAFAIHERNQAGAVIGLQLAHPLAVSVLLDTTTLAKTYQVTLEDGKLRTFDRDSLLHIPALSTDGVLGLSPISVARNSYGIAVAGERSAGRMFSKGPLFAGMVTPEDDDIDEDDALAIKAMLDRKVAGWDNAGDLAVINRKLKFTPWTMSLADAQFLESRQFQVEEFARWFGVPPFALMQTEKQTSWGTGIEAQQLGLSRQVLGVWTQRISQRVSTLLSVGRNIAFDFAGLERPTPASEIDLLIKQVSAGIMTKDEARAVLNRPPLVVDEQLLDEGQDDDEPGDVPPELEVVA